jgi:hypothetical protein
MNWRTPRRRGEEEERNRRRDAAEDQKNGVGAVESPDRRAAAAGIGQPGRGGQEQQGGFDRQPRAGVDMGDLPQQAIGRESAAQGEADPQVRQGPDGKNRHPQPGNRHCQPLPPAQCFAEDEASEQNVGERVEIVAEAARQDVPAVHRINVDQPVAADQQAGGEEQLDCARVAQRRAHFAPGACDAEQAGKDQQ